jgi:exonuclease SbcC
MLKVIHIENYKSLKNVTVEFKDGLNIIIGKNGRGKSNLLEFIDSNVSRKFILDTVNK